MSLHAADDGLRKQLVPTATTPVRELVQAAHRYFGKKGREVTYEVVLLDGVNDRRIDANAMIDALRGLPCTVNLIAWNPVDEIAADQGLARPADRRVDAFAQTRCATHRSTSRYAASAAPTARPLVASYGCANAGSNAAAR